MEDETTVPEQEDEEIEAIINAEEDVDEVSADELKAKLAKRDELLKEAIKTKKNWRTKYEELQKSTGTPPLSTPQPEKPSDDLVKDVQELKIEREKRQFAYQNNLSPEETDFVFSQPVPTGRERKDLLDNPFVKGGLEAVRSREAQDGATPRPSSRQTKVEGKTFEEMKPEERAKNWASLNGIKK